MSSARFDLAPMMRDQLIKQALSTLTGGGIGSVRDRGGSVRGGGGGGSVARSHRSGGGQSAASTPRGFDDSIEMDQ